MRPKKNNTFQQTGGFSYSKVGCFTRRVLLVALVCCLISFCVFFAACGEKEQPEDPKEDAKEVSYTYVIEGATDLYVTVSADKSKLDFSKVRAYREYGDGEAGIVTVDDSSVVWGVKGIYNVKYVCGGSSVTKKIYIYDETKPQIFGAKDRTISSVSELSEGVSAVDQFGISLSVRCFVNGIENGTLAKGENKVIYEASDLVGNTQSVTVTITLA